MVGCQSITSYRFLNMDSEGKKFEETFFSFTSFLLETRWHVHPKKWRNFFFWYSDSSTIVLQLHCSSHISSRKWFVFCKSFWHFEIWLHQLSTYFQPGFNNKVFSHTSKAYTGRNSRIAEKFVEEKCQGIFW